MGNVAACEVFVKEFFNACPFGLSVSHLKNHHEVFVLGGSLIPEVGAGRGKLHVEVVLVCKAEHTDGSRGLFLRHRRLFPVLLHHGELVADWSRT